MTRLIAILALCILCSAAPARAQSDFSHLNIRLGDVVYVTQPSGVEVSGPLTALSPSSLSIDGYEFDLPKVAKIERRGDPIWDGALKGFLVGAGLGLLTAGDECSLVRPAWECVVNLGISFAAIGALIDLGHTGRTTIFRNGPTGSSSLAPLVTPNARGVALAFRF
jgi:hypothetical protein